MLIFCAFLGVVVAIMLVALIEPEIGYYLSIPVIALLLFAFPRNVLWILTPSNPLAIADVAPSSLTLTTYGVVATAIVTVAWMRGATKSVHWLAIGLIAYLVVGAALLWPSDSITMAGVAHFSAAAMVWLAARFIAACTISRNRRRWFVAMFSIVATAEAAVAILQLNGIDVIERVSEDTASNVGEGRVAGTLDHPDSLGKLSLFLIILLLPFCVSGDRLTSLMSWIGTIACVISLGLSEGRATILAGGLVLGAWCMFSPGLRNHRDPGHSHHQYVRGLLFAGIVLVGLMGYEIVDRRTQLDPDGGARPHFLSVAWRVIPDAVWTGLGPNRYVVSVGPTDPLTAEGWPVHNAILLSLAELGLIGFVLFWGLFVNSVWSACIRPGPSVLNREARLMMMIAPIAVLVVAWTGWGLLGSNILGVWCFVFGFLSATATCSRPRSGSKSTVVPTTQVNGSVHKGNPKAFKSNYSHSFNEG